MELYEKSKMPLNSFVDESNVILNTLYLIQFETSSRLKFEGIFLQGVSINYV